MPDVDIVIFSSGCFTLTVLKGSLFPDSETEYVILFVALLRLTMRLCFHWCLCVCLLPGLHKNCLTDFPKFVGKVA